MLKRITCLRSKRTNSISFSLCDSQRRNAKMLIFIRLLLPVQQHILCHISRHGAHNACTLLWPIVCIQVASNIPIQTRIVESTERCFSIDGFRMNCDAGRGIRCTIYADDAQPHAQETSLSLAGEKYNNNRKLRERELLLLMLLGCPPASLPACMHIEF